MMSSYMDMGPDPAHPEENTQEELEQLLLHGTRSQPPSSPEPGAAPTSAHSRFSYTQAYSGAGAEDDDHDPTEDFSVNSDVQGAFGLFAEATQDLATAGLEVALGRHFACADYCNQAAEKAAQAVSLLRQGHRVMYDHDLRALGAAVGAPAEVQEDMALLTPFHPEAFYAETPPEEADEVISAAQASEYIQVARRVLRWARGIIL
ncbi:MAG TPA: HEPN domain-containing protein [Ktedonobacteraceae bacterium]